MSLLVTCALWWSLWNDGRSEVWSGGQTSGFCVSNLSLISTVMHWHWVLHVSTSVFLVQVADISNLNGFPSKIFREGELIGKLLFFFDTLTRRLASWINFINSKITRVWYCDKLRLRPRRHGEQTLTFLYTVHPTWSKRSTLPSVELSPAWMKGQIKQTRISKLECQMRTKEATPTQRQSGNNPKSRDKIGWIVFYFFSFFIISNGQQRQFLFQ